MFAEKENLLHAGPQLQPGKAGTSKLAPKTPGPANQPTKAPKTPFPLDRENFETVKKGLTQKKSVFKLDPSSFVTPVGPRRVPLGGKTTNAKAPASSIKAKIQLERQLSPVTKSVVRDNEDEIPEIEYMPPKPVELPDIPDDWIQPDYQLLKENLFRGVYSAYMDQTDENGKTKLDREMEKIMEDQVKEMIAEAEGIEPVKKIPVKSSVVSKRNGTVSTASKASASRPTSRVASSRPATALSQRSKTPSMARNTTSTTRPTSRVGISSTSRPTSRVSTNAKTSQSATRESKRPRSAADVLTSKRSTSAASTRPGTSLSTASREGRTSSKESNAGSTAKKTSAEVVKKAQKPRKTIEDETEEHLARLVYADTGDDEERVDVANIVFEDDDFVFQFQ